MSLPTAHAFRKTTSQRHSLNLHKPAHWLTQSLWTTTATKQIYHWHTQSTVYKTSEKTRCCLHSHFVPTPFNAHVCPADCSSLQLSVKLFNLDIALLFFLGTHTEMKRNPRPIFRPLACIGCFGCCMGVHIWPFFILISKIFKIRKAPPPHLHLWRQNQNLHHFLRQGQNSWTAKPIISYTLVFATWKWLERETHCNKQLFHQQIGLLEAGRTDGRPPSWCFGTGASLEGSLIPSHS